MSEPRTSVLGTHPFRHLFSLGDARSRRISSWDRSGGNNDFVRVGAGETLTLAEIEGPGIVTHLYAALAFADPFDFRDAVLRVYWDGEDSPSIESPLGDFFGVSHCRVVDFTSLLLTVNPGMSGSHGMNAYFPMPFETGARFTLEHQGESALGGALGAFWYHIDYEELPEPPGEETGRFHARWRRENPTVSAAPDQTNRQLWPGTNLTGDSNYVMLEAEGRGQLVGIHLQVDNIAGGWYGEGDDMYFVDGEVWPPSIHGTGTEEIFGGGACPDRTYAGPYTGFHQVEGADSWGGKTAMYRWFLHDPIRFSNSLRATVEHGHANNFENDYASVAYWYQSEPHGGGAQPFPGAEARRPRVSEAYGEIRRELAMLAPIAIQRSAADGPDAVEAAMRDVGEAYEAAYLGDIGRSEELVAKVKRGSK